MNQKSFYSAVLDFSMFDEMIYSQSENPTKQLNIMLRNGVTFGQLEDFLKTGLTKQFAIIGEGWSGIRRHIRFCETNGWKFSMDIDYFINTSDNKLIFQITGFKGQNKS